MAAMDTGGNGGAAEPVSELVGASALPPPRLEGAPGSGTPHLPPTTAKAPVPLGAPRTSGEASSGWYRTDQQRHKSVYRRANPWYRRVTRGVIGLAIVIVVAGGLYYGAQALQDYLGRDQLPKPGEQAASFASTSFLVSSSPPAPELDGTITLDTASSAFEFAGSAGGPQSGIDIVSPDGMTIYVRPEGGEWRTADAGDPDVAAVTAAIPYLLGISDADDVLEDRLRKEGYVTLVDETTEGADPDDLQRYDMTLDTLDYAAAYPLQWDAYRQEVVPAMAEGAEVPLTMWIDEDDVVVRLRDGQWTWERLAYSDDPFTALDPAAP
jgi:hypothetical protein